MTKKLVEYEVDQETIQIEVEVGDAAERKALAEDKEKRNFKDVLKALTPIAETIMEKINDLKTKPQSVTIELFVGFSGKNQLVLFSAGAEANCKVTLHWERND